VTLSVGHLGLSLSSLGKTKKSFEGFSSAITNAIAVGGGRNSAFSPHRVAGIATLEVVPLSKIQTDLAARARIANEAFVEYGKPVGAIR
jgi:hypothetical protein